MKYVSLPNVSNPARDPFVIGITGNDDVFIHIGLPLRNVDAFHGGAYFNRRSIKDFHKVLKRILRELEEKTKFPTPASRCRVRLSPIKRGTGPVYAVASAGEGCWYFSLSFGPLIMSMATTLEAGKELLALIEESIG